MAFLSHPGPEIVQAIMHPDAAAGGDDDILYPAAAAAAAAAATAADAAAAGGGAVPAVSSIDMYDEGEPAAAGATAGTAIDLAGAGLAAAAASVDLGFRLTVGDEVRLKAGVVKPNCCLTCVADVGEIVKDDFDHLPYHIRAKTGPKAGNTPGYFYEADVELADLTVSHDEAWCAMRNMFCTAAKKRKEGGVVANATVITVPTRLQAAALTEAIGLYTACLGAGSSDQVKYACLWARGECQLKLQKTVEAIEDFTAAIGSDTERIDAYKSRAAAHMQLEQWDDAKTDAMKVRPEERNQIAFILLMHSHCPSCAVCVPVHSAYASLCIFRSLWCRCWRWSRRTGTRRTSGTAP